RAGVLIRLVQREVHEQRALAELAREPHATSQRRRVKRERERQPARRPDHRRSARAASQRRTPRSSACRAALAAAQPTSVSGPPKRQCAPRPVAATRTASLEVPVAGWPSSQRTPAACRTSVFTSVSVATRLTSAAGSGSASTTAIVLIVAGNHAAGGVSPAALGWRSPPVATTSARAPAPRPAGPLPPPRHPPVAGPPHRDPPPRP